jgi:hypothetical protein
MMDSRLEVRPHHAAGHRRGRHIPFEAEAANLFFQLVSSRYEWASVIVNSNDLSAAGAKSSVTTPSPP